MKTNILIEKLERRLNKYYFIQTKQECCDTTIVGLSKTLNTVQISFKYDENNNIIYSINCIGILFSDLCELMEVIKNVIS